MGAHSLTVPLSSTLDLGYNANYCIIKCRTIMAESEEAIRARFPTAEQFYASLQLAPSGHLDHMGWGRIITVKSSYLIC